MRWISGILLSLFVVGVVLYAPVWSCQILVLFLAMFASFEMIDMINPHEHLVLKIAQVVLTGFGVGVFAFFFNTHNLVSFLFLVLASAMIFQMFRDTTAVEIRLQRAKNFVFITIYSSLTFGLLTLLFEDTHYQFWVFLTLAGTFLSDTFAFLIGMSFGKNKLAPKLSPKKTVEGLFGGFAGGILAAFAVQMIFWPEFPVILTLMIGFFIALFTALGDLSESLIKRGVGIKDSGTLIPGHGGLLDRVDGLLFSAPFVYLISFYYR